MPPRVIEPITAAALWVCLPSFLPWEFFTGLWKGD